MSKSPRNQWSSSMPDADYTHICPRCLLRDRAKEDIAQLHKYLDKIKESDRVDKDTYEARLLLCTSCDKLHDATCDACGCYVEYRAYVAASHCPKKKW